MRSFALTISLFGALASASPVLPRWGKTEIAEAANKWAADTSVVSQFLSRAPQLTGDALAQAAAVALAAENDEPARKARLDAAFDGNAEVESAGAILEDPGNFPFVVQGLTTFSSQGAGMSAADVQDLVERINETRCQNVLPAIDTYFRASAAVTRNGLTLVANRPNNCP
ncbi:hypothetical protein F4778DRAFT_784421 [Xylariomycetidae sp. FL2044]|nr:hypothetical protein F4778DRAFT_784421 [Xylariomycetidae sp. FL2044]